MGVVAVLVWGRSGVVGEPGCGAGGTKYGDVGLLPVPVGAGLPKRLG